MIFCNDWFMCVVFSTVKSRCSTMQGSIYTGSLEYIQYAYLIIQYLLGNPLDYLHSYWIWDRNRNPLRLEITGTIISDFELFFFQSFHTPNVTIVGSYGSSIPSINDVLSHNSALKGSTGSKTTWGNENKFFQEPCPRCRITHLTRVSYCSEFATCMINLVTWFARLNKCSIFHRSVFIELSRYLFAYHRA